VDQQDTIFLAQDARLRTVLLSHSSLCGISRIRSFWFRTQNQFQYFRAAIFNPFVSTTTPPYYSPTTYHLRQIYGSTVALKTALKIVPLNYRCAQINTPHFKHSTGAGGLHRLRTRITHALECRCPCSVTLKLREALQLPLPPWQCGGNTAAAGVVAAAVAIIALTHLYSIIVNTLHIHTMRTC
jgi:hypothetical protein